MGASIMFVRVSENCNGGCFMCHYAHKNDSYNITKEQFEKLLENMKKEGTYKMVRFTGGEPLLNKDLPYFIRRCTEEGYVTSIITNGFLLPYVGEKIADAGLKQVIISIDGSKNEYNDELRGLKNSVDHIKQGIEVLKSRNKDINIRANTVASAKNIDDLLDIYMFLNELDFDCWSIIPIRGTSAPWKEEEIEHYKDVYKKFIEMQKTIKKPELLGYSPMWAGQTEEKVTETFMNNFRIVPSDKCYHVDNIRFYIPDKELLVPCNCAAHRIQQIETEYSKVQDINEKANIMADWLREYGPTHCTGCEPLNAYMADNPKELQKSLFKF